MVGMVLLKVESDGMNHSIQLMYFMITESSVSFLLNANYSLVVLCHHCVTHH